MKKSYLIIVILLLVAAAIAFSWANINEFLFSPTDSNVPTATSSEDAELEDIAVVAEGLSVPWDVAFPSGGGMLVTERTGTLTIIGMEGEVERIEISEVADRGEGGLLGMTLHPDFEENNWLYLYETYSSDAGIRNRVVRYDFFDNQLQNPKVIIKDIPGASYHDGGRIRFGPNGLLYITTGDAGDGQNSQNTKSLAGKILRVQDDGTIPENNPFGTAVYSYGHRNPQGLTWDESGRLWSTEHGRSGLKSGLDELNLIEPGENYGWPVIEGSQSQEGMTAPALHSGAEDTWAPASALYWDGSIFWGGLRGQTLYEAEIENGEAGNLKRHFFGEYGRIRAVVLGPDGNFYITTSNTDGRGAPNSGDDKIIRINPQIFR